MSFFPEKRLWPRFRFPLFSRLMMIFLIYLGKEGGPGGFLGLFSFLCGEGGFLSTSSPPPSLSRKKICFPKGKNRRPGPRPLIFLFLLVGGTSCLLFSPPFSRWGRVFRQRERGTRTPPGPPIFFGCLAPRRHFPCFSQAPLAKKHFLLLAEGSGGGRNGLKGFFQTFFPFPRCLSFPRFPTSSGFGGLKVKKCSAAFFFFLPQPTKPGLPQTFPRSKKVSFFVSWLFLGTGPGGI